MAKKERYQEEIVIPVEQVRRPPVEEEKVYEAEAYGSPRPEKGSDVTVMKPVGIGGPVPIVAPKHNTIQLQPIIVPLAVVPYMTQDSNVLRTDGRQQMAAGAGYNMTVEEEIYQSAQFDDVDSDREVGRRRDLRPRIFTLITFIITAVMLLPFFLSKAKGNIGALQISTFNIVGIIKNWMENGFSWSPAQNLIYIVVACLAAVQVVMALVGLIIGKYPKPLGPILAFVDIGCMIGVIVTEVVNHTFNAKEQVGMLVILALAALNFALSVLFSFILNKVEDKAERREKESAI